MIMNTKCYFWIFVSTHLLITSAMPSIEAGMIDFDTNPATGLDWTTEDIFKLTGNEWLSTDGVQMAFGPVGSSQDISRVVNIREGEPAHAFDTASLGGDGLVPGDPSGGWFISHDDMVSGAASIPNFNVRFTTPQAVVGMNILDLDQQEGWRISAFDSGASLLDTIDITTGNQGQQDARSTYFQFDRGLADISGIQIQYIGSTVPAGVGYAFDNLFFSTSPIPEPGSICLMALAGSGFLIRRGRQSLHNSN